MSSPLVAPAADVSLSSDFLPRDPEQFRTALARLPGATLFPLRGIRQDGSCGCGNEECRNLGKHPAVRWSPLEAGEQVTSDPHGWGICTGARSGYFLVETDQKAGINGEDNLRALGELPRTFTVRTPSGSIHRYFRMPESGKVKTTAGVLARGVDVRGDGGMAVFAGSPHKRGGVYEVAEDVEAADAPAWLLELVVEKERAANRFGGPAAKTTAILDPEQFKDLVKAIAESDPGNGERNDWRMFVCNVLLNEGHADDSAEDVARAVADAIGADEVEFAAVCRSCIDARDRGAHRGGWNKLREAVSKEKADAIQATINPPARAREAKTKTALAEMSQRKTEREEKSNAKQQEGPKPTKEHAPIFWGTFHVGDGVEIASMLHTYVKDIVFTAGRFYRYDEERGVWSDDATEILEGHIQSMSGSALGSKKLKLSKALEDYALHSLKGEVRDEDFFQAAVPGIACSNGFLRVSEEGALLVAHAKEHRARVSYDIEYKPCVDSTKWLAFVADLFAGDDDAEAKADLVAEFHGACLFGLATKYQKAIVAKGSGANGKSTLMKAVTSLYPPKSTCSIQPHTMAQRFGLAGLDGALLNYVPELKNDFLRETEEAKAAIVGDELRGENKGKDAVPFTPQAGHFFGANKLPSTSDQSHGFWRRWIVLEFNRTFAVDPTFERGIVTGHEQAILMWLVGGVVRLLRNGGYTIPASHGTAVKEWRESADTVAEWLQERTEAGGGTLISDLFRDYQDFTKDNGHKALGSKNFARDMAGKGHERGGSGSKTVPLSLRADRAPVGETRRTLERERAKPPFIPTNNRPPAPSRPRSS